MRDDVILYRPLYTFSLYNTCQSKTTQIYLQIVKDMTDISVLKYCGYDGYTRVKILAGLSKKLGEHANLQNQAFMGEDLHL